jgi:hypothetical protein
LIRSFPLSIKGVLLTGKRSRARSPSWKYRFRLDVAAGSGQLGCCLSAPHIWIRVLSFRGRMAERFKAAVLKTAVDASPPWVRIPLLPPCISIKALNYFVFVEDNHLRSYYWSYFPTALEAD